MKNPGVTFVQKPRYCFLLKIGSLEEELLQGFLNPRKNKLHWCNLYSFHTGLQNYKEENGRNLFLYRSMTNGKQRLSLIDIGKLPSILFLLILYTGVKWVLTNPIYTNLTWKALNRGRNIYWKTLGLFSLKSPQKFLCIYILFLINLILNKLTLLCFLKWFYKS